MKIVVYSDLHLYNHHRLLVNSETALRFLTFLKNYCLENEIDTIISAGDFFHTKARAYAPHVIQALLRVKDIDKSNIKQYMLVGNHDMANPNNTMNSIVFVFSDYAKIIPDYYFIDHDNVRIHFLSFAHQMFENFILAEEKKNVLIAHLDIVGFTMPNGFRATTGFKISDFSEFDLVITGHYHKHQSRDNIVYIGSPYQTSFAEREQPHGFLVLDTETVTWEFVEYDDAPKYKVISIKKLDDVKDDDIVGNFVKIKLLTHRISKSKLRDSLFEIGAVSVDVIPPEDVKEIEKYYDKALGNEPQEVASAYLNSLTKLDLSKDKLLKHFNKIEEVATKITEYELDEV
jgi:DNA repair exonuclease SbcCD nuclease subunit